MKRLFSRLLLLTTLVFLTYGIIIVAIRANSGSRFLTAIIDKEALLKRTLSPKIVLIGGSNVAVGVDSSLLEKEFGLPVVNMGLHGGLGLRYMLGEVKPYIQANDLVVVSPEYQSFLGIVNGDETLLDVLYIHPEGMMYLDSPGQVLNLLTKIPGSMQEQFQGLAANAVMPEDNSIYNRGAFNRYGDVVSYLGREYHVDLSDKNLFGAGPLSFDPESLAVLKEFDALATSHGARVYFSFPPVPDSAFKKNEGVILEICRQVAGSNIVFLASPADSSFPITDFFDTLYHLNAHGRQVRTERMIRGLRSAMSGSAAGPGCGPAALRISTP